MSTTMSTEQQQCQSCTAETWRMLCSEEDNVWAHYMTKQGRFASRYASKIDRSTGSTTTDGKVQHDDCLELQSVVQVLTIVDIQRYRGDFLWKYSRNKTAAVSPLQVLH
ncbi:hypothetical protein KIN20_022342 [Parelaphostrongylus tenuis]|uniref:Uncharacterized protein n=1 Tax=Parelaphostrongylus tenuis TaxID=148309 RepID=A0AAD5N5I3_PARTN|nr:hypothetical protein KIN20_022342 [Parelaphostrongylus tenuis]